MKIISILKITNNELTRIMKIKINLLLFCFALFAVSCSNSKVFQLVLMPDTQTYTHYYPETFMSQTQWVVDNADSITFVLQQGDITDNNFEEQWKVAVKALTMLDGKVPYTMATGNHDNGKGGGASTRGTEFFNQYFPYEKYSKTNNFGGAFEVGKMDNVWHTFKAGGYKWLILTLEFGPRNSVLDWAGEVIKQHSDYKIIINTHAYMYSDETRMGEGDSWLPQSYGLGKETGENAVNNGEQMWDKLVSRYPNIIFVFSGHVLFDGVGTLVSEGVNGNKVYQMLANYQQGVEGIKGDEGYFRIVTIDTRQNKVSIKTYSNFLKRYRTEPDQQFVFENVKF